MAKLNIKLMMLTVLISIINEPVGVDNALIEKCNKTVNEQLKACFRNHLSYDPPDEDDDLKYAAGVSFISHSLLLIE